MKRITLHLAMTLTLLAVVAGLSNGQDPSVAIDYPSQVAPLLKKYCANCHNSNESEAEFSVSSFTELMKGSEKGPVIISAKPGESRFIEVMLDDGESMMPPEGEPRPTENEIETLREWVKQGAKNDPQSGLPQLNVPVLPAAVNKKQQSITAIDWSPDGNWIAVARFKMVELFQPDEPNQKRVLDGFPGKVNSVRFSSDSTRLVVASGIAGAYGHASIWDMTSDGLGHRLFATESPGELFYSAVLSPDHKVIATASYDRKIRLHHLDEVFTVTNENDQRILTGHNDAIYDLDFSSDSRTLISASGDQTVKVWNVLTGQRLETLGQPLKEQFACRMSPDNRLIASAGRDNRIRIWAYDPQKQVVDNVVLHSLFAHERPIVSLAFNQDGSRLVSSSEDKTIKIWETETFRQIGAIKNQPDICSSIAISPDGTRLLVGRLDGSSEFYDLSSVETSTATTSVVPDILTISDNDASVMKWNSITETEPNHSPKTGNLIEIPAKISGAINVSGDSETISDSDLFRFRAKKGESLIFETRASRQKSQLDSKLEILDSNGQPVPRIVLRAIRDSYFTFRGKDSNTSDDFRVHNWEEMGLNELLYANGEVVKLFHRPRGPDSGFMVYPGTGRRFAFYDTTPLSHALHEPCYIVRPFPVGTQFVPNGLPVFRLNYENDDGSERKIGTDSRLYFVAPHDGEFLVRISDVRNFQGDDFKYELSVRRTDPDFKTTVQADKNIQVGSGKEFTIRVDRIDRYDGKIQIKIKNLPDGLEVPSELTIESGHHLARGTIFALAGAEKLTKQDFEKIKIFAKGTGQIRNNKWREIQGFGELNISEKRKLSAKKQGKDSPSNFADHPKLIIRIAETGTSVESALTLNPAQPIVLEIRPGQTIQAQVVVQRNDHEGRISFGLADAGRNLPHGLYVDDIGLNGLMITQGKVQQRFFVTAEDWVQPQTRMFHLRANDVGGLTSQAVVIRVLEK